MRDRGLPYSFGDFDKMEKSSHSSRSIETTVPMEGSRVIVKKLPKHLTEERLRAVFGEMGTVTDVKIVRTPEGKSRLFGFVGFTEPEEAQAAVKRLHGTYIDTSKIEVQAAHGVGDESLPRPWSKYSRGSSRFAARHPDDAAAPPVDGTPSEGIGSAAAAAAAPSQRRRKKDPRPLAEIER